MFRRDEWSNQSRTSGASGLVSMGLALLLSIFSVAVAAQTAFEFEDPLDEIRAKIERQASEAEKAAAAASQTPTSAETAGNWAASATRAADGAVDGVTAGVKSKATSLAERLGVGTSGLIGGALLGALALGLGLFWLLSRRRPAKKRAAKAKDRDLYAVTNGSRARRTLESGAKVTRKRETAIDTEEVASVGVAATAAKILNDETIEEAELERAYATAPAPASAERDVVETAASAVPADVKADDPSTWRRPNLDRLKASIREDWKGSDAETADPTPSPLQDEAKTFAELFGDDDAPLPKRDEAKSPVLDMLQETQDEPARAAMRSVVESKSDAAQPAPRKPRAPAPSRADAVRRIKALRESVKAS